MNTTILSLAQRFSIKSCSPLLQAAPSFAFSSLTSKFMEFSHMQSPIFFASNAYHSIILSHGIFSSFLSNAIRISGQCSSITPSSRITSSVSVSCCSFTSLSSDNGGAIYISDSSADISIALSQFFYCHATIGGALNIACRTLSISADVFEHCFVTSIAMSICFNASLTANFNQSLILGCSNSTSFGSTATTYLVSPILKILSINLTSNVASSYSASLVTYASTNASISQCTICSSTDVGGAFINIELGGNPYIYDRMIVQNNTIGGTMGIIWTDQAALNAVFKRSCFMKNNFNTFEACGVTRGGGSYPQLIDCTVDFSPSSVAGSVMNLLTASACVQMTERFTGVAEAPSPMFAIVELSAVILFA